MEKFRCDLRCLQAVRELVILVPGGIRFVSWRHKNLVWVRWQHGIELPVAVALGSDPKRVIAVLEKTAAAHPLITRKSSPQALVVKLDAESVAFELRAWTDQSHQWMQIRGDLAITISSALAEERITIR